MSARIAATDSIADGRAVGNSSRATVFATVVVTYNSERDLPGLLQDLAPAALSGRCDVIVVDNGSTDGTLGILRSTPWVTVLHGAGNPGYAAAINIARRAIGTGRALLVLNPDVRIDETALAELASAVSGQGTGIAVPTVLDSQGGVYPSLRREPSLLRGLGDALLGGGFRARPGWLSEMRWDTAQYANVSAVDWATGAALMISADCDAAVGDWDEARFFMYSEETDYCRRARESGLLVRHVPTAQVTHAGGGSGSSPALEALMAANRVRYFRKHHGILGAAGFWCVVALNSMLRIHRPSHRAALAALVSPGRLASLPGGRRGW